MKISGRKQVGGAAPVGKTSKARSDAKVDGPAAGPAEADDVALSGTVQEVEAATETVKAMPDVRIEKVDALKPVVDDGSYHVEGRVIAKKMVDTSLRESAQMKKPRKK